MRQTVPREDIKAGTAHADQIDALRTGIFGHFFQGRISGGDHHRLKENGLMAMNDDIDLILLENAHINLHLNR